MNTEKPQASFQEKIGEGLVRIGALTSEQCDQVISMQKAGDKRLFGEIAIDIGFIQFDVLIKYLSSQKGG